jgi:hypothetical protein
LVIEAEAQGPMSPIYGRFSLWSSLPKWSSSWLLWGWSGVREPWHALTIVMTILDMTSRCLTKSLGCQVVKNCICLITIWILSIPSHGRTCQ